MKKILTLAFTAALALTACNNQMAEEAETTAENADVQTGLKVAYVEVDSLMTQYQFCKDYNILLNQKGENAQKTLAGKQRALQQHAAALQKKYENNGFTTRDELERAQRGSMDATRWVKWFLACHLRAVKSAEVQLSGILAKAEFWRIHADDSLTANQRKVLNMLFDGFKGNLTSSKWAKMCKVSQDTASREINALVAKGILRQEGRGRSTHYLLTLTQR